MLFLAETEGEGFEPSGDLTAANGFRDRTKSGLCVQFASLLASRE